MTSVEQPDQPNEQGRGRQWLRRAAFVVALLAALSITALWLSRERIAGNLIDDALTQNGLEATYEIASIGTQRQIIENLVIGDSASPDLTVDRIIVEVAYGFGSPQIGLVRLETPRLYGRYDGTALSFGALDPLLFSESEEPAGLPAIDVVIRDGGALIETPYGDVGGVIEGEGQLNDGFLATLALTAPGISVEGCKAEGLTAYGELSINNGAPRFQGPLRMRGGSCSGASLANLNIAVDANADAEFSGLEGSFSLNGGQFSVAQNTIAAIEGKADFFLKEGALTLNHDIRAQGLATPYGRVASVRADGAIRSGDGFSRTDWTSDLSGEGADLADDLGGMLTDARKASAGTLAEPLLAKLERNLSGAVRGGNVQAELAFRTANDAQTLVVPEARLRGKGGETVLAVSRLSWSNGAGQQGASRLSGNLLTGGEGLPRINGRMEQVGAGGLALRMTMAEYSAGESRLALPSLLVRQRKSGDFEFAGKLNASGAIPGGSIRGLDLPLNGSFTMDGEARLGVGCETVRFAALSYYNLALDARSLRLCPVKGRPIIRIADGVSFGAQTRDVELAGQLAETDATITASSARFSYPGGFGVTDLAARIGPQDSSVYLSAAELEGALDAEAIGGTFAGGQALLDVVPLDLGQLGG
ncbi:MAG: hypothetical protein SXU28_14450, partial [Pseudomonadota bacterium]|nr:hypothetical protein [Pseudomonadota bacterium]